MEQPTVFYAVAIALAIGGLGGGLNAQIAWAYVALRILNSLVQATVNRVRVRFAIFALASLALIALSRHAFMGFVFHSPKFALPFRGGALITSKPATPARHGATNGTATPA